jgi:hypothetical protein
MKPRGNPNMIAKAFVSAAMVAASLFMGAGTASADPSSIDPNQNPFGALTINGQETSPVPGNPASRGEIERGLRNGLAG